MRETDPSSFSGLSRRAWLKRTALAAGGTLASGSLLARAAPLPVPESSKKLGAPILSPEYGQPSPHESDVVRRPTGLTPTQYSSWSFTPLQHLHGIVTPNGLFFERHHGGVPDIARDQHRLAVHGLVRQPLLFSMDDLVRFPSVSRFHFLECSGNGSAEWAAPTGETVQFTATASSTCPKGVAAMGVYSSNQLIYTVKGASLNTALPFSPGTNNTVVEEWDFCGGATFTPVTFKVGGTTLYNVQASGGWKGWAVLQRDCP